MGTSLVIGPESDLLYRLGRWLLAGTLTVSLLLVVLLTWKVPEAIAFFPILPLGAVAIWYLFRHPLLNLTVVLASFVLIADFEEGIQPTEVLYGLYYLGFLGHWFVTRLFMYKDHVFKRPEDKILFLFLVLMSLSFPLTVMFGGSMRDFMGEWLSLSLLAFYFPVREIVERHPKGLVLIVGVLAFLGLFVLTRNILDYRKILSDASYAWQVTRGRSVTNQGFLMIPSIFSLLYLLYSSSWQTRALYAVVLLLSLAGLILTQSRGYWVAFLLGAFLIVIMVPTKYRVRLVGTGILTLAGIIGLGTLLFGDLILLIVTGLFDRFLSLGSAFTRDISLVNRFYESASVWEHIKNNPILGYGMGVSYRFYDIIYNFSHEKSFIHNGYVAVFYKFGIWGSAMLFYVLASFWRRGVQAFRASGLTQFEQLTGLAVSAGFSAFALSAATQNPFYSNDTMFIFAILAGISGGCYSLSRRGSSNPKLERWDPADVSP
jgi:O-Antigen ligase